jgi:DNA-directed RNA polymerase specialized sigma24 family protein
MSVDFLPKGCPGTEGLLGVALSEAVLRDAFARVVRTCGYHGVPRADAEDLAQDFFLWLLTHPERSELASGPALAATIHNYLLRYRRRASRQRRREVTGLTPTFDLRRWSEPVTDETTMSVRALDRLLPSAEAKILRHLKAGATWAEAASAAGVPPGSRDWLRKRMAGHVRLAFTGNRRIHGRIGVTDHS